MNSYNVGLERIFSMVALRMAQERETLNRADSVNQNHGDHMVEIFSSAAQAAGISLADLAGSMQSASQALSTLEGNGSAQVYARGLAQFSNEFSRHRISLDDLMGYVQQLLRDEPKQPGIEKSSQQNEKSNLVLKALIGGLTAWQQVEAGQEPSGKLAELGALFDLGIIYIQAKQRGGSRSQVFADAAATASPLALVPHRYQSGKLALQTLLEAMAQPRNQLS